MNIKKEVDIIILWPYRFREFDRARFEVECLKKESNVIIYELIDAIYPHFSKAYHTQDNASDVKRFSSLGAWRADYEDRVASLKRKPYVINHIPRSTFKDTYVNYVISKSNVNIISYDNYGIPDYLSDSEINNFNLILIKLKFIIKRATFALIRRRFLSRAMSILSGFLCRDSDFVLAVSGRCKNSPETNKKIIAANSYDYSSFLGYKNVENESDLYKNCIVFLDSGFPLFKGDALLLKVSHPLTVEKWYPAIRKYFDYVEESTSLEIVIASHPKVKPNSEMRKAFGNRRIICGKTQELVRSSKMTITRNSTSISFAVLYNKPLILVHSDELLKDNNTYYNGIKYWSEELHTPYININHPHFTNEHKHIPQVNKKAYTEYKLKYLTSRLDKKTNCRIIMDDIVKYTHAKKITSNKCTKY